MNNAASFCESLLILLAGGFLFFVVPYLIRVKYGHALEPG